MKAYFGALIDKSVSKQNLQLADKIQKELRKNFKKSTINKKEHNTFLFLGAEKSLEKPLKIDTLEKIEDSIYQLLLEYYNKNKTKLKKLLKDKQELKETSQIVKEFLRIVDPKLPKIFDLSLKKVLSDLPSQYFKIQEKSMTIIWDLNEVNETRLLLFRSLLGLYNIVQGNHGLSCPSLRYDLPRFSKLHHVRPSPCIHGPNSSRTWGFCYFYKCFSIFL